MRISIDGKSLCGGISQEEFVEGWDEDSDEKVDIVPYFRAVMAACYPRGNTVTQISFSVTREHDSTRECEAYLLTAHRDIPKSGDVVFAAEGETGAKSEYTLSGGAILRSKRRYIGVTSIISYTIVGGDFL